MNYDENNWRLIANHLKNSNLEDIHVLNRAQLLDDAFNLARSGRLSYNILFELLEYIAQETDYVPLYAVSRGLTYLDRLISGTEYYEEFQVKNCLLFFCFLCFKLSNLQLLVEL